MNLLYLNLGRGGFPNSLPYVNILELTNYIKILEIMSKKMYALGKGSSVIEIPAKEKKLGYQPILPKKLSWNLSGESIESQCRLSNIMSTRNLHNLFELCEL